MTVNRGDVLRDELASVVQRTSHDVRHPWYVFAGPGAAQRPGTTGPLPDDLVDEVVTVALRRWWSRSRRATGRRNATHDLGLGLARHFGAESKDERGDFFFLADVLAEVLRRAE